MAQDIESWPTGRLLSTAARMVEHSWESLLRSHGLTHAGLIALHCLGAGPLPQRQLAKACRVTDQTISRTVDKLARSGLVARARDAADERRVLVTITDAGVLLHQQLVQAEQQDTALTTAVSDPHALRTALIEIVRHAEVSG